MLKKKQRLILEVRVNLTRKIQALNQLHSKMNGDGLKKKKKEKNFWDSFNLLQQKLLKVGIE